MVKGLVPRKFFLLLAFLFYFLASQANFLFPGSLKVFYLFTFVCAIFGLRSLEIRRAWFKYILIFLIFSVLAIISYLFGGTGDLSPRPLFAFFIVLVIMLYVASWLNEDGQLRIRALDIVLVALWVEVAIILLQFSYLTWGVGIVPRNESAEATGFITGSFGNANNVAVIIVLEVLLLIAKGRVGRDLPGYFLVVAAGCAIFLTLSRTALVVYLTVLVYFGLAQNRKIQIIGGGRFIFVALVLTLALVLTYLQGLGTADNAVIGRSMDRVSTFGSMQHDSSVQFRITSMMRLGEGLGELGLGTMSDLNYGRFFDDSDEALAKANPHSLIAEASFLFGYLGLAVVLMWLVFCFFDMLASTGSLYFSVYFISVVAFFQSVPSSVLSFPLFFYLVILLCRLNSINRA